MHAFNPVDSIVKPTAKLFGALVVAFISANFIGLTFTLFGSAVAVIANVFLNNSSSVGELIAIPVFGAVYLTGAFGIYIPMYIAIQIVLFGIPAAIVAWLLKLMSFKTISIAGFVLAGFPWIPIAGILVFIEGSSDLLQKFLNFGAVVLVGIALGLGGFISGASFWMALRFLRLEGTSELENDASKTRVKSP